MNKQLTAFLIITCIFLLAMKDSASFVHTLLHYIPNNPWHQHAPVTGKYKINPMEIHKHLQHIHAHTHEHNHAHTHDFMDHIHSNENPHHHSPLPQLKRPLKVDLFIQSYADFSISKTKDSLPVKQYSLYTFSCITHFPSLLFQPPQLV